MNWYKPDDSPQDNPHKPDDSPHHDHELVQAPTNYGISGQVILIGLFLCCVGLLLFIFYNCLRHRQRRRRLNQWRQPRLFFSNRTEPSPHRLDQNTIDLIPVIEFSLHGDNKVPESCAVCISEFTEGEKLRALPQCGHRFHMECIDMWFASHSTCPLCRADVNSPSPNSDQQMQLGETENKELCTVHQSSLDRMV